MGIRSYAARRILEIIPVILAVILLNFFLVRMAPGDIAGYLAGGMEGIPQEVIEGIRIKYGLNKPVWEQFTIYFGRLLQGDLGNSYVYGGATPVLDVIMIYLPNTLLLLIPSYLLSITIGIVLGIYAARKRQTKVGQLLPSAALLFYSFPAFWLAILAVIIFSITLNWFPTSGLQTIPLPEGANPIFDMIWHLVLPVGCLTLLNVGQYVRITQASIMEIMKEEFVTTARAIGYTERTVFWKHVLRNAFLPTLTIASVQFSFLFTGAMLTETVFSLPGLGRLIFDSAVFRDYPVIMGVLIITAIMVAVLSLITDIIYAYLDPRIVFE